MRIDVPPIFRIPDRVKYPTDNWPDFEYWFMDHWEEASRDYLPIMFTSYFKNHSFGRDRRAIEKLQQFVDRLPTNRKYYCVVQYDDGVLIDWGGRDVMVFAMSGKPKGSTPIPLVCQPHSFSFNLERDFTMSFIGRVTDPVRQIILDWGKHYSTQCYITDRPHSLAEYCRVMARSKYVICPRGYGASSFRIGEALQYGAVPLIFNRWEDSIFWDEISFQVSYDKNEPPQYTKDLLTQFFLMLSGEKNPLYGERAKAVYQKQYTFEGVREIIKQALHDEDSCNTRPEADRSHGHVTARDSET